MERDGRLYSLDNRRLWAAREAGVPVVCRLVAPDEVATELASKLTTNNDGTRARMRAP